MKKIFLSLLFVALFVSVNAQPKKRALIEHFTGAACGPCAAFAPKAESAYTSHQNDASVVKYHMFLNRPTDDIMYVQNPQTLVITDYYQVASLPTVFLDGHLLGYSALTTYQMESAINAANAKSTPFDMNLVVRYNQNMDSVFFTLQITPDRDTTFSSYVRVAINMIEKEIIFSTAPGSNGEKEFHHVKRMCIPREDISNYGDTTIQKTWQKNQTLTLTYAAKIPGYIYHKDQLTYVAYIQTGKDRNVLQSAVPQNVGFVSQEATTEEVYCDLSSFAPKTIIKNGLDTAITSVQLQYALNNEILQYYTWKGRIEPAHELEVTLPSIESGWVTGSNRLLIKFAPLSDKRFVSGSKDTVSFICVDNTDHPTMSTEEFNNTFFPPVGWYVAPNTSNIWTRANTSTANTYAAKATFFKNLNIGKIETMYLQKQLIPDSLPALVFDYAYLGGANYDDGIRISISDDCGATWTKLYEAYGFDMTTVSAELSSLYSQFAFTPNAYNQWVNKRVPIDKKFAGKQAFIKVEAIIDGGNNYYIDNIQVKSQQIYTVTTINTDPARGIVNFEGTSPSIKTKTVAGGVPVTVIAQPFRRVGTANDTICHKFEYWYKEHIIKTGEQGVEVTELEEVILSYDSVYTFTSRETMTTLAKFSRLDECVIVSTTKVVDVRMPAEIKYISNPVNNMVTIDGGERSIRQVEIYDMMGRKYISQKKNASLVEINVEDLQAGMYIVKIYTDKGIVDKKITKL